jgi:hypothetical protein
MNSIKRKILAKTVKPATAWREAKAAETIGITASTAEGRPVKTVLASAGTPTAQYERQKLINFRENSPKSRKNGEKFVKNDVKRVKNSLVFVR